jgi:AcrR family transcriptional regulator
MPKRVDHDLRKRQIADALLRVADSVGLHAAGMREVASEAKMSVRLVQYYFETKERLLLFGLQHLGTLFRCRIQARLASMGDGSDPRALIRAILEESLPTDRESRTLHHVYTAYHVLALTDPKLAAQPFLRDPNALEASLIEQLRLALRSKPARPSDLRLEVVGLMALTAGLGTSVLAGQRTASDARKVLRHHLGRLFKALDEGSP